MKITFPEALPVSRKRDEISAAMKRHQVVIVCGDTGSGKTTQLPKIALEMGRGQDGRRIGCTQPRRIAATSVAKRVAEELQVELGAEVGYQIRFQDNTKRDVTSVKFMTDGILLAETRGDQMLKQYDTLIIDEAHERSLNIDFILGYLHRLLPKRPDLKVVISSATLDAETFADFFTDTEIVQVEGRAFPVEDVYQPPLDKYERLADQVARAAEDLASCDPLGDTLVFLPGEREIRDVAELLEGRRYASTLVLPLFARQAGNEQQQVFKPSPRQRRIILATNVAETSLTIPDIRSVIDSGIARVNRFDPKSGIQRLQIEPVSKASARQRRGRCGRIAEGICVRLYDEEDFEERSDFTDPEILRSNLSGVVLQMEHLGLGDPLQFPFVDPPQPKRVAQAYKTLDEIGAIWKKGKQSGLTDVGRTLARLPLDPCVGRLLVAAADEDCLREGLIIASALTVQDPRERPQDKQEQANQAHAKFRDKRSDFTGWLRWWHAIEKSRNSSNNSLRKFCRTNFLNYRRLQEWINLQRELRSSLRDLKWKLPDSKKSLADPEDTYHEGLHRAILTAIPSHIGYHQGKKLGYKGTGGRTFFLFPGSGVFGSAPQWTMAFEMVETAKLYARNIAFFDPTWMEKVVPQLCRYSYTNPHWVPDMGAVYGEESVFAFGLPIIERRRVHYGRVNVEVARKIFILEALVNGEVTRPMKALAGSRETLAAAERLEHKLRRINGLLHPPNVLAFFEERVPRDICTQKTFEKWAERQPPGTLDLTMDDCIIPLVDPVEPEDVPDVLLSTDKQSEFPLQYLHTLDDSADGITVQIPLADLPHVPPWFGDWMVPAWLEGKVSALFRILPKFTRQRLPSNREVTDHFLDAWDGYAPHCSLKEAIIEFLDTEYGVEVVLSAFEMERLPAHLSMTYEIIGEKDKILGYGKDLGGLQEALAVEVQARFTDIKQEVRFEKSNLQRWSIGDLPETVELDRHTVGYPGLHDSVALRLWPTPECAAAQHRFGVAALFRKAEPVMMADLEKRLFVGNSNKPAPKPQPKPKQTQSAKPADNFGSFASAFGDAPAFPKAAPAPRVSNQQSSAARKAEPHQMLNNAELLLLNILGRDPRRNPDDLATRVLLEQLGSPRTQAEWDSAVQDAKAGLTQTAARLCGTLGKILTTAETISRLLEKHAGESGYDTSLTDTTEHFNQLLRPGWLLEDDFSKKLIWFRGLELRLTRMFGSPPVKDLAKLDRYYEAAVDVWAEDSSCECGDCPVTTVAEKQIEEANDLRVIHFAQELRR